MAIHTYTHTYVMRGRDGRVKIKAINGGYSYDYSSRVEASIKAWTQFGRTERMGASEVSFYLSNSASPFELKVSSTCCKPVVTDT